MELNFGQRIRKLREKRKITQKALALILNVSESAIGMYERGEREPNFETVEKMAIFFAVSFDYLLGRTDNPTNLAEQLLNAADKAKQGEGVQEQSADSEKKIGRAFLGGSDQYTEEELDLARAAAKAAVDAYRKAQKKTDR